MELEELKRRAGIVEDESITECPDTDGLVQSASGKIQKVMQELKSQGIQNREMFATLQSAVMDLSMAEAESKRNHEGD